MPWHEGREKEQGVQRESCCVALTTRCSIFGEAVSNNCAAAANNFGIGIHNFGIGIYNCGATVGRGVQECLTAILHQET